jgi:uncharacterized membrane protein
MQKVFDFSALLARAWQIYQQNAVAMSIMVGLAGLFTLLLGGIALQIHLYAMYAVLLLIAGPIWSGFYVVALRAARGRKVKTGEFLEAFPLAGQSILLNIAMFIFSLAGLVVCLIPMFFVFALYLPAYLFMIEDRQGFWRAMESSRIFTLDNFLPWLQLMFIVLALIIGGFTLCFVGIVVTLPIAVLLVALAYEQQRHGLIPPAEADAATPSPL